MMDPPPTLTGERVGVILFYFLKSEGSSVNLTNVTAQNWRAAVINNRGIPLNVFTGLSADQTGRVMATGRNDGSGTRHAYLIEPGMKPSQLVNQFKLGVNGFNGVTSAGFTGNNANFLQLWPASDAQDANNNSVVYPGGQVTGNGGYFSGSNVATLLGLNTSAVRVLGPTGTDLSSTGSYVGTSVGNPRAVSVIGWLGQSDAVNAIAAGAGILSYNGVLVTPVASGVDPTGLVPADRYKVTNGSYTAWTYERLFSRAPLTGTKDTIVHGTGGIVPSIPTNLANNGIAISAMVAVRVNDGDVVTQP